VTLEDAGTGRAHLPVVRVRLPCADGAEFERRFGAAAAQGISVPTARARPVGARVDLVIELRDGTAIRGEALAVDATPGQSGKGVTFKFVRLTEGHLPLDETDEFVMPSLTPAPGIGGGAFEQLFTPAERRELMGGGAVVEEAPAGGEPEPTIDVPVRRDVLEARAAGERDGRERAARRRLARLRLAGAGVALATAAALAVHLVAGDRAQQKLDAHLALADERLAEGRLAGGGDTALDHLVAARTLGPDDARVRERLRLVADKLEELADVALARGDWAEAAVHLTAASQAEPQRRSVHLRLGEIARSRGRSPRAEERRAP
jgi:hypothetical protein